MKRIVPFFLIVSVGLCLIFSCTTSSNLQDTSPAEPEAEGEDNFIPGYPEIGILLKDFERAVRTADRNLLAQLLTPEPTLLHHRQDSRRNELFGFHAVAEFRLEYFEQLGSPEEYHLPAPADVEMFSDAGMIEFIHEDSRVGEYFHVKLRNNTWRISRIEIATHQDGDFVTNSFQALGDKNRDGVLNDGERADLGNQTHQFFQAPHTVASDVDTFFDNNKDGLISGNERQRALEILVDRGLRFWEKLSPEPPLEDMDINRDGIISDSDFTLIMDNLSGEDIDIGFLNHIIALTGWVSFPDAVYQAVPRSASTLIDTLADGNNDGSIDEREQQIIMRSLSREHDTNNYFDRAIDDNRDGTVHWSDIQLILQASAMGWKMTREAVPPPYGRATLADSFLDADRSGEIDKSEIDAAVAVLAGDLNYIDTVSTSMQNLLDSDNDGEIDSGEINRAKRLLAFPHSADGNEALDRELDRDKDGFISPGELGISAGVTNKGPAPPFDERIALYRRRGSTDTIKAELESAGAEDGADTGNSAGSVFYENLASVKNGTLAVLSIEPGTEGINKDEASVATIFVENAFVNIGNVSVVDRDHLVEIRKEVELNLSGLIDEASAVKIGKLAGADIIAVGSISKIEDSYYLYLQLISVETGEILGSSIAESARMKNFLEMSIQVVSNLF